MPINVVSVSMTYPTADRPARGVFVQRRLEAMARRMNVRVIAPRPWLSRLPPARRDAPPNDSLDTRRPSLFYLPGFLKPTDPWFYARLLRRELIALRSAYRPDIVDAHFEWPDGVGAAWAARRLGLPFAVTLRGKLASHGRFAARRIQIRDMLRRAALRIAVSRELADRAAALAGDGRPVHVIPNGVESSRFHPRPRDEARRTLGLDPAARYLVSVGYVQELKGFDRLVAALPRVRARCGDVRLLLVGDEAGEGDYARALDGAIAGAGLGGVVRRVMGASADDIALHLNAADLFVLATRSEGWCNAIHESLACGTPVVTTDVGGNRELVRTSDDGRLVPFGDAAALEDAIAAALWRDWPRAEIAARAGCRTWDDVGRDVHDLFTEALRRRCIRRSSAI